LVAETNTKWTVILFCILINCREEFTKEGGIVECESQNAAHKKQEALLQQEFGKKLRNPCNKHSHETSETVQCNGSSPITDHKGYKRQRKGCGKSILDEMI
jgi:hypothetical protein